MRKMNVLTLFISLLIAFSCSETEENLSENLKGIQELNEKTYLYELDILYVGTVTRINELKEEKQAFVSKAARKDRTALKKLERTQREIEKLIQFKNYLLGLRGPKGPKPIILPPIGCLVENNCDPRRNLQGIKGIVLNEEFKTTSVLIRDAKNRIIAEGGDVSKNAYGQPYIQLEGDFKSAVQLEIAIVTEELGEITTKIPVYKN